MSSVALTSKGQMTLPKAVRDDLGAKPGDRLEITKHGDGYLIRRKRSASELFSKFRRPRQMVTVEEMDAAIEAEVWERNRPKNDRG